MEGNRSVWFTAPDVAKRLAQPFTTPGGPSVVAGAAASKRQRVSEFQEQAAEALAGLSTEVQQGLAENVDQQLLQSPILAAAIDASNLKLPYMQVTLAPGAVLPPLTAPGMQATADASTAAAAAAAAASAAAGLTPQPGHACGSTPAVNGFAGSTNTAALLLHQQQQQEQQLTIAGGCLPASCLLLESVKEAAACNAAAAAAPAAATAAVAAAVTAGSTAGGVDSDDVLQPGSEVVVTFVVFEAGAENRKLVMQQLQVLGSNTLSQLRDAISCPLDRLAAGLGAHNPAAYFFLDNTFYDDTRAVPQSECSLLLQRWAAAAGLMRPRALHVVAVQDEEQQQQQLDGQAAAGTAALPVHHQEQLQLGGQQEGIVQLQLQQQQYQQPQQQQQQQQLQQQLQQQQQPQLQQLQQPQLQQLQQQQAHGATQQVAGPEALGGQQQAGPAAAAPPAATAAAAGPGFMHLTCISDLTLQATNRATGLFSHQGCCEHPVMVADVRLLHASDPLRRSSYPRVLMRAPLHKRYPCNICRRHGGLVLMMHHPETPECVVMLCERCEALFDCTKYPQSRKVSLGDTL